MTSDILQDLTFENCVIAGPAVLGILEDVTFAHCSFDAPDASSLFWAVPDDRPVVVGVIAVKNVSFYSCRFERIGLAVPEDALSVFLDGFDGA